MKVFAYVLGGLFGVVGGSMLVYVWLFKALQRPELTDRQLFVEYPQYALGGSVLLLVGVVVCFFPTWWKR